MPTQADIAKATKVNRTSISKILCGSHLEFYSDEVIEKVKRAALKMGYKHRSFKNAMNIAFLVPVPGGGIESHGIAERIMETLMGINEALKGSKHRLHIVNIDSKNKDFDFDEIANGSDAFIAWGLYWKWTKPFFLMLDEQNKDYVFLGDMSEFPEKGSYIFNASMEEYIDNALAALSEAGHKRIGGVIGANKKINWNIMKERFSKYGLDFSRENILPLKNADAESCRKTAREIAEGKFTAIFVHPNDITALELVIELGKLNMQVPEDVSVLGNHKKKSLPNMGIDLSSFTSHWFEMGRRAGEILLSNSSRKNFSRIQVRENLKQTFYNGNTIKRMEQ